MSKFKHRKIPELDIRCEVETTDKGRVYRFDGKTRDYPSITTVLSRQPNPWLHEWRKRVGEEEANRIGRQASMYGTKYHSLMESYIQNERCALDELLPNLRCAFNGMKLILDKHVDEVLASEVALYSDYLRVAGRVDLVALWDGVPSIVDFKTSKRHKAREDIKGYFIQATAYAIMFEEMTTIPVPQIIIAMTVEGDPKPLIFYAKRRDWEKEAILTIEAYR